jgi:hypothetical protein
MNNLLDKLKADLEVYTKKKDQISSDALRLEGILLYLQSEINKILQENIDKPNN